ncbi:MAG TPA: ABC transporter permease [Chloroflexota bacterium]|jgi:peptide/nickel transport system permease protein
MINYCLKRLLLLIPVILGITLFVFLIVHLIPGNPALVILGSDASAAQVAQLNHQLGLDQPLWQQFFSYVGQLAHGDLGTSLTQHQSVSSLIGFAFPNTVELAIAGMIITLLIGIPLGVASAVYRNSILDYAAMALAQLGTSMPVFWLGTLLVQILALDLGLFPSFGIGPALGPAFSSLASGDSGPLSALFSHLLLPALTLGLSGVGVVTRMVRSAMIEALGQDYIRTARAKGLKRRFIIWRHALRNGLLTVITIIGLQFGYLLGGAVIVETIFAWPGLGRLAVNAILARDFPVVQGCVLVIALMFAIVNLVVDLAYGLVNPRIRLQ